MMCASKGGFSREIWRWAPSPCRAKANADTKRARLLVTRVDGAAVGGEANQPAENPRARIPRCLCRRSEPGVELRRPARPRAAVRVANALPCRLLSRGAARSAPRVTGCFPAPEATGRYYHRRRLQGHLPPCLSDPSADGSTRHGLYRQRLLPARPRGVVGPATRDDRHDAALVPCRPDPGRGAAVSADLGTGQGRRPPTDVS